MPRALQKVLLREDAAAEGLTQLLAGNRLAAWPTPTGALLCYPVGINSEALALTSIQLCGEADGPEGAEAEEDGWVPLPAPKVRQLSRGRWPCCRGHCARGPAKGAHSLHTGPVNAWTALVGVVVGWEAGSSCAYRPRWPSRHHSSSSRPRRSG